MNRCESVRHADSLTRPGAVRNGCRNDADPRVQQLMREMDATWHRAATNGRRAGAVDSLEGVAGERQAFRLVPHRHGGAIQAVAIEPRGLQARR